MSHIAYIALGSNMGDRRAYLDGAVDADDAWRLQTNRGRSSACPEPATALQPALQIVPERITRLTDTPMTFYAVNAEGATHWTLVSGPSGAAVSSSNGVLTYQAGPTSAVIDVIQGWDDAGKLARAYVNVIGAEDVAQAGKAIIIAGRKGPDDVLFPTTEYLSDLAYGTLLYRGLSKENILYLHPAGEHDGDGDGSAAEDVDAATSWAAAAEAFTNWVGNADRLFVYLVDHGGAESAQSEGYFRLREGEAEKLHASQLDTWLDAWQDRYQRDVVVLIDCCYAGNFLKWLEYRGTGAAERVVIASCAAGEASYFVAGGLVSFSDAFFGGVLLGLDVGGCFEQARQAMQSYQHAWLDDDGDGVYQPGVDGARAAQKRIGASFVAGKDAPIIGRTSGDQLLMGETAATLWADQIASAYPLESVWCTILPPDAAVPHLAEARLSTEEAGRFVAGRPVEREGAGLVRVYCGPRFLGVGEVRERLLQPRKVLGA